MKVVHIATSMVGGAGVATKRIHRALLAAGCESSVLCLFDPHGTGDEGIYPVSPRLPRFWERGALRAGFPLNPSHRRAARLESLGLGGVPFSEPVSEYDLASHPAVKTADIIHLHWVGGFLDWKSFFGRIDKPVVWTLHDRNPLMGGFHLQTTRDTQTKAARDFDAVLEAQKVRIMERVASVHVVAPSDWLATAARNSATLGHFPVTVVNNPIDSSEWRPFDRRLSRDVLGLPMDETIALTVTEKAGEYHKGADLLEATIDLLGQTMELFWARVGAPSSSARMHSLGSISDQRLLSLAYSAADLFVIPSREENFPNVILESLCIGTPVIGLPAGGIPEMIEDGVNGVLAGSIDSMGLVDAIRRAGTLQFNREAIRRDTAARYAPSLVARKYLEIYDSLLS